MAKFNVNKIEPIVRDANRELPRYSVFDVEANNWKDLVVVGFYDGITYKDYGSIEEMLLHITDMESTGAIPDDLTIFAHNGGAYDFNFVLEYVIRQKGKKHFRIEAVLPRGSTFLAMEIRRMYHDENGKPTIEGPLLTFRDSLALLPFSLASLTDAFKTECAKGEWDHDKDFKYRDDPRLLEYLKADCVGLYQVLNLYFSWPMIKESGVSFTVASQALRIFRTTLDQPILGCSRPVDAFVRKAYFGGRTEIFKPYFHGTGEDKLSCWDVNSLYPSVMRDFEYPTTFIGWTKKYDPKSFGFWEATVEVPEGMYVPPLGTLIYIDEKTKKVETVKDSSEGKFFFPTGTFSGCWTTIELEYAKTLGVKVLSTGMGAIFENGGKIFEKFVNELYERRKAAPKDSVDSFICKLILNSSYGRFGLNLEREQLVIDEGQDGVTDAAYEFETGEMIDGVPEIFRFVKETVVIDSFSNVAIAAWVTAQSRIRMHKQYMKMQKDLFYTDTDSCFNRHDKSMESSPELGQFKYEYSATEACFLLPKTYALAGITGLKDKKGDFIKAKAVIKGINKEAMKMRKVDVNDLYNLLEGDFRRAHIGPMNALEFNIKAKFAKVRTAMSKGTFLYIEPGKTKEIKSRYDKRVIVRMPDGTYDTEPVHIQNGLALNYSGGMLNIILKKKGKKKTLEIKGATDGNHNHKPGNRRKSRKGNSKLPVSP